MHGICDFHSINVSSPATWTVFSASPSRRSNLAFIDHRDIARRRMEILQFKFSVPELWRSNNVTNLWISIHIDGKEQKTVRRVALNQQLHARTKLDILKPVRGVEMNIIKSRALRSTEERAERRNKSQIWGFPRKEKPQKSAGNVRLRRYLHELNRVLISFSWWI